MTHPSPQLLRTIFLGLLAMLCAGAAAETQAKEYAVFYPPNLVEKARTNVAKVPWAAEQRDRIVEAAQPWMKLSDDDLWSLMFGHTITRSWMVWSNGFCPSCKHSVPMYTWEMAALERPWKVRCPHCKEQFPKNDFHKFYLSGLDEHGVFDPKRADRSLLFNADHPDPSDPLHKFGVDDGEGYVEGENRWRFIGAYLIYGQWKQAVLGGINKLAAAYVVTGDTAYAHKAGVLLDRVADLYPTFDFAKEGLVYEVPGVAGYVSTWHDACEETRELVLAYDAVFEGLRDDAELVTFLSRKAKEFKLDNPKASTEDIRRNIEDRILRDALENRGKIHSNYPRTEIAVATTMAVLGWPGNREEVYAVLDPMLEKASAVDGVTGEKGLAGYTSFTIQGVATVLEQFSRLDPGFLKDMLDRHPRLHDMYRFHIDTWCFQQYYPVVGDSTAYARKSERYVGVGLSKSPGVGPSMYTFLWKLYEITGDAAFVQVLFHENGGSVKDLPYDLFADAPRALQRKVQDVIAREGATIQIGSVNKRQWHLAILRSGRGPDSRALWLEYDSGGGHGHLNGMNLGLFAKGLDLMPDFGYPPVQYGGWGSPRARWYTLTAAHNTVAVDVGNTRGGSPPPAGETTLWADGERFRAIRASGPDLIEGKRYERTAALVDISDRDSYVVDIFRVIGGTDHAKFFHSHFGTVTTQGLSLSPGEDYGKDLQMRDFRCDPAPQPGWSADWKVDDRYGYLPPGKEVRLRYTDLTTGAQACTCEGWVTASMFNETKEVWIPRLMVRRQAKEAPLASTFVSVIEPYEKSSNIAAIRRLPLTSPDGAACPDADVAIEITLADGRNDLIIAADAEDRPGNDKSLVQKDWNVRLDGELCLIRLDKDGKPQRIALCGRRAVTAGDLSLKLQKVGEFIEIAFDKGRARVEAGNPEDVAEITLGGKPLKARE